MKRIIPLMLIVALSVSACSSPEPSRESALIDGEGAQVQGVFYKDTALCLQNSSAEAVDARFGVKYNSHEQDLPVDYWYWNQVRMGKKNSGQITLNPGQKVCSTSATYGGLSDSVLVSVYFQNGAIASVGADNGALRSPAFYPMVTGSPRYPDWNGSYSLDEARSMMCQSQEYEFLVNRLVDGKDEKNWLVDIRGPADPDYWPNAICEAR
jgi:hypothetical protein